MSRRPVPPGPPAAGAAADDGGCTVLHVDMDAFYASVEVRRRPELRGRKVIVGHAAGRGVVLSATYEARRDGVRSAMPMSRALRLCPDATVVGPDFPSYAETSRGVFAIFRDVTPLVEGLSLDEAFLDVAGAIRLLGSPRAIGEMIRARVAAEQGITCSVGVAPTKFLAKLASVRAKPDGLLVVPVAGVEAFLHPLPVADLWGVGERTEAALRRLGLRTVADLAAMPVSALQAALGPALGAHLSELAHGRDPRRVNPHEPDRSVGAEETFAHDIGDPEEIHRELLHLSERVARRLRARGWVGRTVSIKVRFADFTTVNRSRTLPEPTDVARDLHAVATALFDALGTGGALLRLVGVRVEGLRAAEDAARQLALDERPEGWREAELATDRVAARFGSGAVRRAALLDRARPVRGPEPPRD